MKPMPHAKNLLELSRSLLQKRTPGQLVIQFTDRCNASCPQCGMRKTEQFQRSTLATDDVKRILDSAAEKGVKVVSFTGGEPLLYLNELTELIQYAGNAGIEFIRTGTNGFVFMNPDRPGFETRIRKTAKKLSDTPLRNFWISIDSALPEVHEKMRGLPGVIKGIEKALPIFHEYGLYPSANLGINRNVSRETIRSSATQRSGNGREENRLHSFYFDFRRAFQEFYRRIIDMGFTMVNSCYPMSVNGDERQAGLNPVYAATSGENVVRFGTAEKCMLYKAALDTIPEFRSRVRIFSPRVSLYAMHRRYGGDSEKHYACRGGIDYFFVDSKNGHTYPCGYRGNDDLGHFWELGRTVANPSCHACDWECFRDPSELFGPFVDALSNPLELLGKMKTDSDYFRIWREDLLYFWACGFFNGRKPPSFSKLRFFSNRQNGHNPTNGC